MMFSKADIRNLHIFGSIALSILTLLVLLIFGGRDIDEYPSFIFSTIVHFQSIFHGVYPFWETNYGFGTPLPVGATAMNFHPLGLIAPFVSVRFLYSAYWVVHLTLGIFAFGGLLRDLGIGTSVLLVTVVAFCLSAPTIDYSYVSDWMGSFFDWTFFPVIIWATYRFIQTGGKYPVTGAIGIGLLLGFYMLNSHYPQLLVMAIPSIVFVVFSCRFNWRILRSLLLAAGLAVIISGERTYLHLYEGSFFLDVLPRHGSPGDLRSLFVALFDPFRYSCIQGMFAGVFDCSRDNLVFVRSHSHSLGIVFSSAAVMLVIFATIKRNAQPLEIRNIVWTARGVGFAFLTSIFFVQSEPRILFDVVSATWKFRDPMIFFGMLGGAMVINALRAPIVRNAALIVQVLQSIAIAAPAMWYVASDHESFPRRTEFFSSAGLDSSIVQRTLAEAKNEGTRILIDDRIQKLILAGKLKADGYYGEADIIHHGLAPITGQFKGVSMQKFYPDAERWYGRIQGRSGTITNNDLLDILGVKLLAIKYETYAKTVPPRFAHLEKIGQYKFLSGYGSWILFKNIDFWPRAFFIDEAGKSYTPPRWPDCDRSGLLCKDLSIFKQYRTPEDVQVDYERYGYANISFESSDATRILVLTWMHRPEWQAKDGGGNQLEIFPVLDSFVGIEVPSGIGTIELRYVPVTRIILLSLSGIVILFSVILGFVFGRQKWLRLFGIRGKYLTRGAMSKTISDKSPLA